MLTGVHVAFIGGDSRQKEVVQTFLEMNAEVSLIGFDQINDEKMQKACRTLSPEVLSELDALILPISGTDDHGWVESDFSTHRIRLQKEHIQSLPERCPIFTGIHRPYLTHLCTDAPNAVISILDRDEIAIYNSIPTVEGALMMAIEHTDITIHGAQVVVLGFGRTGITLSRTLHGLGAHVSVGARSTDQMARITEMGMRPFHTDHITHHVTQTDMLFNTIPSLVIDPPVLNAMPNHTFILDLASKPGGTDFAHAEKNGLNAVLAPGLPGKVAPKTAGRILAKVLPRLVKEQITRR